MTRGIFNWTAEDVIRFLKDHKFSNHHTRGSHMYYLGHIGGQPRQVCVPFHGSRSIKPRTLMGIIKQSGISKEEWMEDNK